jgi:hypothetical protein
MRVAATKPLRARGERRARAGTAALQRFVSETVIVSAAVCPQQSASYGVPPADYHLPRPGFNLWLTPFI